jgi:hypothetical protein
VIVDDLDISRTTCGPHETQPELIVDPDAVLPAAIASQCLEPIPRSRAEEIQRLRGIKLSEFAHGSILEGSKARRIAAGEEGARLPAAKRLNHFIVLRST